MHFFEPLLCTFYLTNTYYDTVFISNSSNLFSTDMRNMIVENMFLKMYNSWECFLENVFIEYMLGKQSENGVAPEKYVFPLDTLHAYNMIKNVSNYPDWTDVEKILTNARNFFKDGGAFLILETLKTEINHIKRIRNYIAHSSLKARKDFENLVRYEIGHLPSDISAAIFLVDYEKETQSQRITYYEYYLEYLKDSATMIIEYQGTI